MNRDASALSNPDSRHFESRTKLMSSGLYGNVKFVIVVVDICRHFIGIYPGNRSFLWVRNLFILTLNERRKFVDGVSRWWR